MEASSVFTVVACGSPTLEEKGNEDCSVIWCRALARTSSIHGIAFIKKSQGGFWHSNQLKAESTINCYIFSLKYFQILTRSCGLIIYQIKWLQSAQRARYTLYQLHCVKVWCKTGWRKRKDSPQLQWVLGQASGAQDEGNEKRTLQTEL